jgi:hypothetical protein
MEEFLRKIKLIDNLTTHLDISQRQFVDKLSEITENKKIGLFSNSFEPFSSNKREFVGQVNFEAFKIKRRTRLFETNQIMSVAKGTFIENNGQLTIETEINGLNAFMMFIYLLFIIIYSIVITVIVKSDTNLFALVFVLIQGSLMFSLPYLLMKRNVQKLKYELEREFFYLTKK